MEEWQRDFEWLRVRHYIKDRLGRPDLPDLNAVLFLVGIQELGYLKESFSKEEKQDLMHLAICSLLSEDGHYEFVGRDADGWPHYKAVVPVQTRGVEEQERLLIEKAIRYFRPALDEEE